MLRGCVAFLVNKDLLEGKVEKADYGDGDGDGWAELFGL